MSNKKYLTPWAYSGMMHEKMMQEWEEASKAPHEPTRPLPSLTADQELIQKYISQNHIKRPVKLKEVLYEMCLISYEELLTYPDGQSFFDV